MRTPYMAPPRMERYMEPGIENAWRLRSGVQCAVVRDGKRTNKR